ncbi:hypothetical protein CW755_12580 [Geobacillus thermodenitrificans]|nr:hypothetical protein [Geobacillus thermodenitrificans]NNU87270.1 hypothetical protein [Geobacillus sp. MR]OQP09957.1 hypothetical protein B1691_08095 [Geobacillus sp. 47C-IIb]PJW21996.1 hypothetical protein CV632_01340 [Geobacillus thermodenitrificans]PTR46689.1 hypothetical protein CW755_12580 [Geobacillus thermodenitrificans]
MSKNLYTFHFNGCFTKYLCQISKNFAAFFEKNFATTKKASRLGQLAFLCLPYKSIPASCNIHSIWTP